MSSNPAILVSQPFGSSKGNALISAKDLVFSVGGPPLLDEVRLQIHVGERIGLLGRNGAGKSTLLKLLAKELDPDAGEVSYQQGLVVARLEQEVPPRSDVLEISCLDMVCEGVNVIGSALVEYHGLVKKIMEESASQDPNILERMQALQEQIEQGGGWDVEQRAETVLTQVGILPESSFHSLSGGLKRRVLLARALVQNPDVLLLDEPTNHLDIHSIRWMETFFARYNGTLVCITHDRDFLQAISNTIWDLDRGKVSTWNCSYLDFLERKEAALEAEERENAVKDKKLSQEEAWIRRGVKARRARNEGRVRALHKMREERKVRRSKVGSAKMELQEGDISGRVVAEAKNISFGYGQAPVIKNYSGSLLRGERIGLVGSNGSGKTTLIKLLLGELLPQQGSVVTGTQLHVSYFDQLRDVLDLEKDLVANLGLGGDSVEVNGKSKHVMGYLQDFLFTPDQIRNPARYLSGGEKNRLLLARLFTKPSNVLVLDEPTNDLDIETLELLEELLLEYKGTVLLISHDRAFVNRVVTHIVALEGNGEVKEYPGRYESWLENWDLRKNRKEKKEENGDTPQSPSLNVSNSKLEREDKKSRNREIKQATRAIEKLEAEQAALNTQMGDPHFYEQPPEKIQEFHERMNVIDRELEEWYTKWEEWEG
jgi:ATP-binding cassette subfamily F protein uup